MLPDWDHLLMRLFLVALSLTMAVTVVEGNYFDVSSSPVATSGHHLRKNAAGELHLRGFPAVDHRVTNITTQIGTHAYLPCKVSYCSR